MVEGTSLENWRAGNGTEGSNPSLSATLRLSFVWLTAIEDSSVCVARNFSEGGRLICTTFIY